MEAVFFRFDSYNFEADQRFQDGLQKSNMDEARLLDMKLFFYNRFIEPIDRSAYRQWRSASSHDTQMDHSVEHRNQEELSDSGCDVTNNKNTETSTDMGAAQLSFAEVMRLVQEGKEVPGVAKLDIQPSNQSPTPSQMERILKPWEMSSMAK